ncbi:MAG: acylphosphatase [Propionibacteriaceae bacterium]|jgi:acylphosphatase|nr:acylphosphatase [Propionibacteriaceae bacterium]
MHRAIITVEGHVQGVGFRWWAMSQARELNLVGYADNLPDGRVKICAQGDLESVIVMLRRATEQPSTTGRPGWVTDSSFEWRPVDPGLQRFDYY